MTTPTTNDRAKVIWGLVQRNGSTGCTMEWLVERTGLEARDITNAIFWANRKFTDKIIFTGRGYVLESTGASASYVWLSAADEASILSADHFTKLEHNRPSVAA